MRIVVLATGNVGTSVVGAVAADPQVESGPPRLRELSTAIGGRSDASGPAVR